MRLLHPSATLAALALCSAPALAGFSQAVTPAFRGAACTHYGGWESFTQPYAAPNAPDVAGSTAPAAALTQLVPGAILTSTGNLYHPSQPPRFELADAAAADVEEVVLQVSTNGNALSQASFALRYVDAQGATQWRAADDVQVLVQSGGHEELYLRWDLSSLGEVVLAYTLEFQAAAANTSLDAVLLDVREACSPFSAFCLGDGSGAPCPCGNSGASGHGCANSFFPGGARLDASGIASVVNDTVLLQVSGASGSLALFFQGGSQIAPTVFDDGLTCVGSPILRLRSKTVAGGTASYPEAGDPLVSVRGQIPAVGGTYSYQVFYRNAAAAFCPPGTSNRTNGVQITWAP